MEATLAEGGEGNVALGLRDVAVKDLAVVGNGRRESNLVGLVLCVAEEHSLSTGGAVDLDDISESAKATLDNRAQKMKTRGT